MLTPLLYLALGGALGAAVVLVLWMRDRQGLVRESARLEAERDAATRSDELQRSRLADSQAQLRDAFAALSRSALKENREDFLGNAESLLAPMRATLERVQRHLTDVDKAREGSFQAVSSQLGLLISENIGINMDHLIVKYNGRPISSSEVYNALVRIILGEAPRRIILKHGA